MMAGPVFPKLVDQENRIFFFFCHSMGNVGSYFPYQGLNSYPLHGEHKVLTTGPSGKYAELCLCAPIPLFGLERGLNLTELVGGATGNS